MEGALLLEDVRGAGSGITCGGDVLGCTCMCHGLCVIGVTAASCVDQRKRAHVASSLKTKSQINPELLAPACGGDP